MDRETASGGAERRKILSDSYRYLAANVVEQVVSLIDALVIPLLLSPAQFGVWNLMNVVIGYGANGHLGLLHGMNKMIPAFKAQGREDRIEEVRDSAFWVNLGLGVIAGLILFLFSFRVAADYVVPLRIVAGIVVLQMVFVYYFSLLRACSLFKLVSSGGAALAVLQTIFVVAFCLVTPHRLAGALFGLLLAYIVVVGYWYFGAKFRFGMRVNSSDIRTSFNVGAPIITLGFIGMLFTSIDRWVIAKRLDPTSLGYYAFGIMISNVLILASTPIANVLFPRMIERFSVDRDPTSAEHLLLGPMNALAILILLMICAIRITVPPFVHLFLSKYDGASSLITILVSAAFFLATASVSGMYLIATELQGRMILFQLGASALALTLDNVLVSAGYGVVGVALATFLAYAASGASYTMAALFHATQDWARSSLFLARLYAPFFVVMAAFAAADWAAGGAGWEHSVIRLALTRFIIVGAVLAPTLWLSNRDGDLFPMVRSEIQRLLGRLEPRPAVVSGSQTRGGNQ